MFRRIVALGFAALVLAGMPLAVADDVIVDGTEVTAKAADGKTTAAVQLFNVGDSAVQLNGIVVTPACAVTPRNTTLAPGQSTEVTLTLGAGCPADEAVVVDLDGAGPVPEITVNPAKASVEQSFQQLLPGLWIGLLLALLTMVMVGIRRNEASAEARSADAEKAREAAVERQVADIRAACERAGVAPDEVKLAALVKLGTQAPNTSWSAPLTNLEASWKFSDSWLGNANVAAAGVVTLLSTTDLLGVLFSEVPEELKAAIAMGAAGALLLVAVANAMLRAIGPQTKVPTVLGFGVAAALSVLATTINLVTVASAVTKAKGDLGLGSLEKPLVWGAALVGLVLMAKYVWVSAKEILGAGLSTAAPSVPDAVRAAWVVAGALQPEMRTAGLSPLQVSAYAAAYGVNTPSFRPIDYPSAAGRLTSPGDEPLVRRSAML